VLVSVHSARATCRFGDSRPCSRYCRWARVIIGCPGCSVTSNGSYWCCISPTVQQRYACDYRDYGRRCSLHRVSDPCYPACRQQRIWLHTHSSGQHSMNLEHTSFQLKHSNNNNRCSFNLGKTKRTRRSTKSNAHNEAQFTT
jgi:hypothetical protein